MSFPIFPENGLANSVIPTVYVGLGLSTFFAETLGWNFSGLIVPGYLAPILIVKPVSGVVIVIEAIISYIILRLLSDLFSKAGIWTSFFGQDAFFALFCISILVKSAFEGPMLPFIGAFLQTYTPYQIDYINEFHSTGLIVVPLMANIFWRHGFRRNLLPSLTIISLTYCATRYILIPYTNFSVNRFELLYSEMATDFVESPRFYLILLIGAAVASHNRYRYGWAYHGMLIPALMGIAWLTPIKIVTTFVESGLILVIASLITKQRFMKNITLEGPRKLLFMFTIGFVLKMILGFVIQTAYPGYPVTDLYGFAYILPSLIAMEMWTKSSYIKVTRVMIQTSLFAALAGLALNMLFQFTDVEAQVATSIKSPSQSQPATQNQLEDNATIPVMPWVKEILIERLAYGVSYKPATLAQYLDFDRKALTPFLRRIVRSSEHKKETREGMISEAAIMGYSVIELMDSTSKRTFTALYEKENPAFQGVYVFRSDYANPYLIEAPNPLTEENTLELAISLFESLNARSLFISGSSRRQETAEYDVTHLQFRRSMFQLMHQATLREFIEQEPLLAIQVRGAADISDPFDLILSTGHEMKALSNLAPNTRELFSKLTNMGLKIKLFAGDQDDASYSSRSNCQQSYIDSFKMGEFASLWFSSDLRSYYSLDGMSIEMLTSLQIPEIQGDLFNWCESAIHRYSESEISSDSSALHNSVQDDLKQFSLTENILFLEQIKENAREMGYQMSQFFDTSYLAHTLLLTPVDTKWPAMMFRFNSQNDESIVLSNRSQARQKLIGEFYLSGKSAIIITGGER